MKITIAILVTMFFSTSAMGDECEAIYDNVCNTMNDEDSILKAFESFQRLQRHCTNTVPSLEKGLHANTDELERLLRKLQSDLQSSSSVNYSVKQLVTAQLAKMPKIHEILGRPGSSDHADHNPGDQAPKHDPAAMK